MNARYSAIVQKDGDWWIGWVKEIPGVGSQGKTREELLDNLRDALKEALEMNRAEAVPGQKKVGRNHVDSIRRKGKKG